jgi:ATP-dependent DNA ligase
LLAQAPASYVIYDLLEQDGSDLRARHLEERRQLLHQLQR